MVIMMMIKMVTMVTKNENSGDVEEEKKNLELNLKRINTSTVLLTSDTQLMFIPSLM